MSAEICNRSLVEGEIAAIDMVSKLDADTSDGSTDTSAFDEKKVLDAKASEYDHFLTERAQMFTRGYRGSHAEGHGQLRRRNPHIISTTKSSLRWQRKDGSFSLIELTGDLYASDMHELMFIYELKERLSVCLSVIAHLKCEKGDKMAQFCRESGLSGQE